MLELALALAALIGILLGALGGGGSILVVPVLVYVLDFDPKQAIAMSLPVVGFTSLIGACAHWRAGHIALRPALAFGLVAMAGAFGGARLAAYVPATMQLTLLAAVMMPAALSMLRQPPDRREEAGAGEPRARHRSRLLLAGAGLAIGGLTGLVGIGGGFLFVPALVLLLGVPMHRAVGTSLVVIAMNAGAGFAGYLGRIPIPWPFVGIFLAAAGSGIVAGVFLGRLVPQRSLQRAFGVFLLAVSGLMLLETS